MANINGLPVFEALVDSEDTGMLRISLVDDPAVMSDFLAFAGEQRKVQRYAIADEDRHLVFGVVMRADFPIYRYDEGYGGYYIIYKADTIRRMAQKYLAEGRQNNVDLMHDGNEVEGVEMVQAFLKDTAKGVAPAGFEDIADGSLFAEFHIEDEDIWAQVKDGTFKGFSLEGIFEMRPERDQKEVDDIVSKTDNFSTNHRQMSKMNKIKAMLAKLLASLASVTTDKGVLEWDGGEDLKAGDAVFVVNQDGEREAAADGDYITEDGKKIVVADGKVSEIVDQEAEVDSEPEGEETFGRKATDKGELLWEGEEDLKAGDEVFVENEGERQPAPDGEYATEDGKVIVVVDGKVAEIKDAEAEVAPEDVQARRAKRSIFSRLITAFSESYEEKSRKIIDAIIAAGFTWDGYLVEAGDDYAIYCTWDGSDDKYTRFAVSWDENGDPIIGDAEEVRRAFVPVEDNQPSIVEELRRQIAELKAKPMAKPAHEEVKASSVPGKTGIKGLDRLAAIMSAK